MAHGHGHEEELPKLHGIAAEFSDTGSLLAAAKKARAEGYTKMDAYSPFPIHGLSDAIGFEDWRLPKIIFAGGCTGCFVGFLMQYWMAVIDYPMNVGGKPLLSWPQMIPITYECTILFSAFSAVIAMCVLNGLPQPYHSIFNTPNFSRASQDKFFLCIEAHDPKFDEINTAAFLRSLDADNVSEVPV